MKHTLKNTENKNVKDKFEPDISLTELWQVSKDMHQMSFSSFHPFYGKLFANATFASVSVQNKMNLIFGCKLGGKSA